jgi:hypothetical protein
MKPYKFLLSALLVAGLAALVFYGCKKDAHKSPTVTSDASGGKSAGMYDTPILSAGVATLQSIDITVTMPTPGTGAPAGFSIQWMTKAQFDAINDVWPLDTTQFCKASFSGKAFASNYNLAAGGSVTVTIGDLLLDNGASTNCPGDLTCGTAYVFRAFAHGDSKKNKSLWSNILTASTLDCPTAACIHGGQGYYMNTDVSLWPGYVDATTSLTIGTNSYTYLQCQQILWAPVQGNGLLAVASQLIPAYLNQISGAVYDQTGLNTANAYIGGVSGVPLLPPYGTAFLATPRANTSAGIAFKTLISGINKGDHTCN